MNDDEKFDRWLASAAQEYNRPPEHTPRAEMWGEIERGLDAAPVPGHVRPLPLRRGPSAPVYAIAATLLLAVGIGSGYWLRGRTPRVLPPATTLAATPVPSVSTGSFDAALQTHMADAEAFLVAYRGSDNEADAHVRLWARDVLGTTRLMMDSPAASNPGRRRLLEDLELILVQIVQLPAGAPPADERALIDRSLRRDQLLTRLRTSNPAGTVRGT